MVVPGGYTVEGGESKKTMKRKFKEKLNIDSSSTTEVKSTRSSLTFGDEDIFDEHPIKHIPLHIRATMANSEVRIIMVDQGS